jgi:adenosylcobinamide-GDP ribazoletransferase
MPPLAYETVAWLRHYTCLPIAALPGEGDQTPAPHAAYAAPIAGALLGAIAGLVLLVAALVGAPSFLAAALALLTLLLLTCGRGEQALAASAEELGRGDPAAVSAGARLLSYGLLTVVLVVLIRVGALDGLAVLGPWRAGFALLGAVAVSRAATIAFALTRPASAADTAEPAPETSKTALQWVAIIGVAIGVASVMPFHGIAAAIAGLVGAIGAVAILTAFVSRDGSESERFSAGAELISEIAFLLAVLAFATRV